MTDNQRQGEIVDIEREGQKLYVTPSLAELRRLQTTTIVADNSNAGFQLRRVRVPLHEPNAVRSESETLCFRKGLEPAIRTLLAQHRRPIGATRAGWETVDLSNPHPAPWTGRPPYSDVVEWICRNENGILVADPGRFRVAQLVQAIRMAFPTNSMAVVSDSVIQLQHLKEKLQTLGLTTRVHTARTHLDEMPLLTLSTFYGLDGCHASQFELIFVIDAPQSLGQRAQLALGDATRARLYGVLTAGQSLTPREHDWLNAVFGFARHLVAGPDETVRPIRTLSIRMPACGRIDGGNDARQLRQRLRSNRARNDRIIRIVRRANAWLREQFSECDDHRTPGGVAIVVDDLRHAIVLARKLASWHIVAENVIVDGLSARERRELAARQGTLGPNSIITISSLRGRSLDGIDVLVRAAPGPGLLPLAAVTSNCNCAPLLVVDLADRHHPLLRRWLLDRHSANLAAGWTPSGQDPSQVRIEQFLEDWDLSP